MTVKNIYKFYLDESTGGMIGVVIAEDKIEALNKLRTHYTSSGSGVSVVNVDSAITIEEVEWVDRENGILIVDRY